MADEHPNGPPLADLTVADFLDQLASSAPTPGGGSASALAGALGAALNSMVCQLTLGKPEYAAVAAETQRLLDESEAARAALAFAIEADAGAYGRVVAAYRLPRSTDQERSRRKRAIHDATMEATREPLDAARVCGQVLDLCEQLIKIGNPRLLSDVVVAALLARAALEGAAANVEVNLPTLGDDPFAAEARAELAHLRQGREGQLLGILKTAR
jgi:formiminotetrahydrofolate cyclodeaminase